MKKTIIYLGVLLLAFACTNKQNEGNASVSEKFEYPYTLEKPYNDWQTGDQKNAVVVLKMIKAWETKNVAESVSYFADSVDLSMDYYHEKLAHDSIAPFLESSYTMYASNLKVEMQDWESVVSKDGKQEWVTLWYKQSWVDAKGVADSINLINDARLENGKIVEFSEYVQHFPVPKK